MKLIPLPAFADNYIWMLHDGRRALVVDPGDAQPVLQALQHEGVQLQSILVTHHHGDHTGGIETLCACTGATVFGPASEPIPVPLERLSGSHTVHLLGMHLRVLDVPGHTAGHIAYYGQPQGGESPVLFCGDTLFSAGCGRLFEGTPGQMLASLNLLASLPDDTRVCCAHEYTLSNLRFAQEVDPQNQALADYAAACHRLRQQGLPTLPTTLAIERQINPFLRSDQPDVIASVRRFDAPGVARNGVFATLRQWKNQY
jgi:hydroxyacylglutathione hydrolase